MSDAFFDTNVILYLVGSDAQKAQKAEKLILGGGHVSVQVLNEVVAVMRRQQAASWQDLRDLLAFVTHWCKVHPLELRTHETALHVSEQFQFHIYDASIIAAAKLAQCKTLWSEDMQDGQMVEGVKVRNPF